MAMTRDKLAGILGGAGKAPKKRLPEPELDEDEELLDDEELDAEEDVLDGPAVPATDDLEYDLAADMLEAFRADDVEGLATALRDFVVNCKAGSSDGE